MGTAVVVVIFTITTFALFAIHRSVARSCHSSQGEVVQRWAKVPSQGLSDMLAETLKEDDE